MKNVSILILLILCCGTHYGQININPKGKVPFQSNAVSTTIHSCGDIGWDLVGDPNFTVSPDTGPSTVFASNLWVGAVDVQGNMRVSAQTYRQTGLDYFPGPMVDSGQYDLNVFNRFDKVWKVSRQEVNNHIQGFNQAGYAMPFDIQSWPAHGDTANGEPWTLAPFVDVDNNMRYTPAGGDYPLFYGDEATYTVYSDGHLANTETGGASLNIDIHTMVSGYDTIGNEALNQTLLVSHKIVNRNTTLLRDVVVGQWTDFDLGFFIDDAIGCDTIRNAYFAYNYDSLDEGTNGFGVRPPAQAVVFLDQQLDAFAAYDNSQGVTGYPLKSTDYYQYLSGHWKDSSSFTAGGNGYQGTQPVKHILSGDPTQSGTWAAVNDSTVVGQDIKGLGAIAPFNLAPGEASCINLAFVYARADSGDHLSSVKKLQSAIDQVQAFFDGNSNNCQAFIQSGQGPGTSISHIDQDLLLSVGPNPVQDQLSIQFPQSGTTHIQIFNLQGQRVFQQTTENRTLTLPTHEWSSGTYILHVQQGSTYARHKLTKR